MLETLPTAATFSPFALEARGVEKTLGREVRQTILHGISLAIAPGELAALTGQSGSGKSTLLYLLGALDKPTRGQILIGGVDASGLDDDARAALRNEQLGFVFQFHFLLPEFSALENTMIPMLRRGLGLSASREKARATLDALGLGGLESRRPGQLSGGQQQRVSIARALAGEPRVLLADEPTGSLDSESSARVFELFEQVNRERGVTVVMVTHDPALAARAPRQVVLRDGRIAVDERR